MSDFERFNCPACERWECDRCGRSRYYSNKSYEGPNKCANCGSLSGTKRPIRHSSYYIAQEHLEDFRQTQMAERDIQRIQEAIMAERESPEYTAEDFAKAEWCTHPGGFFGHRVDGVNRRTKWAVTTEDDDVRYYTDDELAAHTDFVPVKIGGKPQLSQSQLNYELSNVGLQDVEYPAILNLLEAVGVDVEPVKPAISDTPGDRVWLKAPYAGTYEYLVTEGNRLARLHDGLVLSRAYVVDTFEVVEGPDEGEGRA